jgi:hypothetical protein
MHGIVFPQRGVVRIGIVDEIVGNARQLEAANIH